MPSRPKQICRHPVCQRKTKGSYCEEHKQLDTGFTSEVHPWYQTKRWRGNPNKPLGQRGGLREAQLLSTPYCEMCKKEGRITDVTGKGKGVCDHIIPWGTGKTTAEKWELFTDPSNLQSLCVPCDRIKTAKDKK